MTVNILLSLKARPHPKRSLLHPIPAFGIILWNVLSQRKVIPLKILLLLLAAVLGGVLLFCLSVPVAALCLALRYPLSRFYRQRAAEPDFCPFRQIPEKLVDLIVLTEDQDFYTHHGLDFEAIRYTLRANAGAREVIMGGSTISQQLVKNVYFRFEKNHYRKAIEALLTLYAERVLGKQRILELYLNIIYFGNGKYGITDAAEFYFGKRPQELTANQMLMLACIIYAPATANPIKHPQKFLKVRNEKLTLIIAHKTLPEEDVRCIRSYDIHCLDPELRPCGWDEAHFPDTIVLVNERFGLPAVRSRKKVGI